MARTQDFAAQLATHRDRLVRLVSARLDPRIRGRVDPSDVIQETYLEAAERAADFLRAPAVSFFVWLRFLALQRVAIMHRRHLGAQRRDVRRETSQGAGDTQTDSSWEMVLASRGSSPSSAAARAEQVGGLADALRRLPAADCEILALRHFEQLSNMEAAEVLGLSPSATCNRYVRAVERLRKALKPSDCNGAT